MWRPTDKNHHCYLVNDMVCIVVSFVPKSEARYGMWYWTIGEGGGYLASLEAAKRAGLTAYNTREGSRKLR